MKPLIIIAKGVKPLRNGNKSAKEYPYWDELIRLLSENYEIREVIKEPLDELENLVKSAKAVICCDSFLQHFCWSVGVKAIVLWGTSDPLIFGHAENINLLKSRAYVRVEPFDAWEGEACNPNAFVPPQEVIKNIPRN